MEKADLLIELGVEELPADSIEPAAAFLKDSFEKMLSAASLNREELITASTPRRLTMICRGLDLNQADRVLHKTGPAKSICFDASGNPCPALLGFLKKNQAELHDLSYESNERGEFVALDQQIKGSPSSELIKSWLIGVINQIPFPKKMVWNGSKLGFIRPLRWILALWNNAVLPVECYGLKAGKWSYGNRYLGLENKLEISLEEYFAKLQAASVIADRAQRKEMLIQGLKEVFPPESGLEVVEDPRLVETVTDLVEYPTAVVAEFEPAYLELPEKIIISTISQNQKYFSVQDTKSGKLSNKFVFISNGDPAASEIIRLGNEKVVRARLADALWYYREDTAQPLESYVPKLETVVFQSKLGTIKAKAVRIQELSVYLAGLLGLDEDSTIKARRAAQLCKADLVTTMLGEKEFTKLQGYIGMHYALASGEDTEVAEAIYEHYMPRGERDSLPGTLTGAIVAVADKLDTICGIFSVGLIPTGSGDPFALRRAANGIYSIVVDRAWNLDLDNLTDFSLSLLQRDAGINLEARKQILSFLKQRLSSFQKAEKLDYDVIDSVLQLDNYNYVDLLKRAEAIQAIRQQESFIKLVIGFKRVSNIIAAEKEFNPLQDTLLENAAEKELASGLKVLTGHLDRFLASQDYHEAIRYLVEYGKLIDSFFDQVLVNVEDIILRKNRYALLSLIRAEFLRLADISVLVVEQTKT
ncbi:MAG TPA: glycine--tRNA ligase subunit beta [Candidatus Cloacimonadota bacterium]|nr:glycine--tRNA ligase subunit beta [Candidatus Cloacimonadota bacterium]